MSQFASWTTELCDNMARHQVLLLADCRAVNDDATVMALAVAAAVAVMPTVAAELSAIAVRHLLTDANLKESDLEIQRR